MREINTTTTISILFPSKLVRLEMKPHEQKRREKQRAIKNK
jgi:hypothetical protein